MPTLADPPPGQPAGRDLWLDALKLRAIGRTSASFRTRAADPEFMRGMALMNGTTPEQETAWLLAVAATMDDLAARGLTPEKCYFLAGLDKILGTYISPEAALYMAAALIAAGHTEDTLPANTRPEVAEAFTRLQAAGLTPAQATEITVTGKAPAALAHAAGVPDAA